MTARTASAPNVAGRRVAARRPHRLDDRIGLLDALCLLKLAQIVPCGQQDERIGVEQHHSLLFSINYP
jgi:hypothetical protein